MQQPAVLLIGSTGFIGRRLKHTLEQTGHRVKCLVRPRTAERLALSYSPDLVVGDLNDPATIAQAVRDTTAVVYAAGAVRGRVFSDFVPANVNGVTAVAKQIEQLSDKPRLLLISSLAASEPQLSHYAASKAAGEQALAQFVDIDWTILRPPAVYGPGDVEMRPILDLLKRGIVLRPGGKDQRVALLHVDDLVRAVTAWLAANPAPHQTFAIDDGYMGTAGAAYSWTEMAQAAGKPRVELGVPFVMLRLVAALNVWFARMFGYAPMLTPGKASELQHERWVCDNKRFTEATGWEPAISLQQGIHNS